MSNHRPSPRDGVGVVIPCYRARSHILNVLTRIGPEVARIYVVDDACPEHTGTYVEESCSDPRLTVLHNPVNLGVGGAVMQGYRQGIKDGLAVLVKVDGDGQMDPAKIAEFVAPILGGEADYTKGNRFFNVASLQHMPAVRILGNSVLSFLAKLSTGYWHLFDPTNGYTAIHVEIARRLPFDKISSGYFFETDVLFRLSTINAAVLDIPMDAFYGEEKSNLKLWKVLPEFIWKHLRNFAKRIFYNYFLRDFSLASLELIAGVVLLASGSVYGAIRWYESAHGISDATPGAVMLAAIQIIVGVQNLLGFFSFDMSATHRRAVHKAFLTRRAAIDGMGPASRRRRQSNEGGRQKRYPGGFRD